LLIAVETLAKHKPFFTSQAAEVIKSEFNKDVPVTKVPSRVTSRERQIIQLLAEGNRNKEIALSLGISFKTVVTHRSNVMRKLEMHNISDLVRYAVRNQIIAS
jgi:DNA-binding NarL/FixJ family response regulator